MCPCVVLRDIDSGVLVADKVDVGLWEVFTDEHAAVVARLIVPLETVVKLVVQQRHASLVAPPVGLQRTVGLGNALWTSSAPVVVLQSDA